MRPSTPRGAAVLALWIAATTARADDMPRFEIEKGCKALPLATARSWCVHEESCAEQWLAQAWRDVTAGVSRDAVSTCVTLAKAAGPYRYWTLRHCLAPTPETGGPAACE